MPNVCLMGVGEASIKLIVDHWVNFSYLENPSFPKRFECGGYDGRLRVKWEEWLASNTALLSGTTFMGFTDSNDGDDGLSGADHCFSAEEPLLCFPTRRTICSLSRFKQRRSLRWGLAWSLMSPADCRLLNILLSICFSASGGVRSWWRCHFESSRNTTEAAFLSLRQ